MLPVFDDVISFFQGHCLMVRIYFGYGKPSYFFGEISALTIGKLIRMFGGKTESIPAKVSASGFPKGALVRTLNIASFFFYQMRGILQYVKSNSRLLSKFESYIFAKHRHWISFSLSGVN